MDKKICTKCSTENESNYVFCKYCGAMLPVVDKRYNYPLEEEASVESVSEPEIDGVSLSEMSLYIGKRPHKFIPKFIRMEAAKQNLSFCGPVFLLGILFGFFGTSFWFFWRKMSKIGWIFASLGILMIVLETATNYDVYSSYMQGMFSLFSNIMKNPTQYSDPDTINNAANLLIQNFNQNFSPLVSLISKYVGNLITPSVISLFAMYLYKKKAVLDIKRIKSTAENSDTAKLLIAQKGGCSGLLLLAPILIQIFLPIIAFILCII